MPLRIFSNLRPAFGGQAPGHLLRGLFPQQAACQAPGREKALPVMAVADAVQSLPLSRAQFRRQRTGSGGG